MRRGDSGSAPMKGGVACSNSTVCRLSPPLIRSVTGHGAAARQSTGLMEDDSRGRQPFLSLLSLAFLDALASRAGDINGT